MKRNACALIGVVLSTVSLTACGNASNEQPEVGTDAAYLLRGDIQLHLAEGTTLDADELQSRGGYGATFTDPLGRPWFARVATLDGVDFPALGFRREQVGPSAILLGTTPSDGGGDCHLLLEVDPSRAVALSRPMDSGDCPANAAEVAEWLPIAEALSSPSADGIAEAQQALSFGSYVGSYNGVDAYSNGSTSYVSNIYSCCGIQWQCVEYVNRYYVSVLGHQNLKGTGNANQYFGTAASKGLLAYANGSSNRPAVNDMLVSKGGSHGHIAIVREVGPSSIKVIQQNWFQDSSDNAMTLPMNLSNGAYTVGGFSASYPVQGWLRKPAAGCTPTFTSISPTSAKLNQNTTFTVTGSCLPSTLAAWIDQCANVTHIKALPTEAQFRCTPSFSTGPKAAVIKRAPGGAVIKDNLKISVF